MKHARDLPVDPAGLALNGVAPFEAVVIAALRGWERGGAGAALSVLRARMTEAQASAAMAALCDLAGLLCASRRRTPDVHGLGADEAAFVRFVQEAALGERETAMMCATALVEGPALMALTDAAARFGLHVHRATLSDARDATGAPAAGAGPH